MPTVDAVSGAVSGAAHEAATAKSMEALQTQQCLQTSTTPKPWAELHEVGPLRLKFGKEPPPEL